MLIQGENHVQLKMDNTSAIAYINKMGGTAFPALNALNKKFWQWCMEKDISAVKLNNTADTESREMRDRHD